MDNIITSGISSNGLFYYVFWLASMLIVIPITLKVIIALTKSLQSLSDQISRLNDREEKK